MSDYISRAELLKKAQKANITKWATNSVSIISADVVTVDDIKALPSAELPKGDLISRADVLKYPIRLDHYDEVNGSREFVYGVESVIEYVEALPSADAEQVTSKLKNPCDSLLTGDSDGSKEQKSKLEPSDLISRADVLKHIDRHRKYHTKWQDFEGLIRDDYAENFIKKAPSVSAERVGEWNTGKPTKRGKYIVTLIGIGDYRFVEIMHYDKPCMPNREVSGECWYRDDDEWGDVVYDDKDIIAWIPLPKPYKGGDDE